MSDIALIGIGFYITIAVCFFMSYLIMIDLLEVLKTSAVGKSRIKLDSEIAKFKSLRYFCVVWPYVMN